MPSKRINYCCPAERNSLLTWLKNSGMTFSELARLMEMNKSTFNNKLKGNNESYFTNAEVTRMHKIMNEHAEYCTEFANYLGRVAERGAWNGYKQW